MKIPPEYIEIFLKNYKLGIFIPNRNYTTIFSFCKGAFFEKEQKNCTKSRKYMGVLTKLCYAGKKHKKHYKKL